MLTPQAHDNVAAAIRASEESTNAEIFCVLAASADDYNEVPIALGVVAALLTPLVILLASTLQAGWKVAHIANNSPAISLADLIMLQAIVFLAVFLLTSIASIKRLVTPAGLKRERVRQRALEQFHAQNLHQTKGRTGVLLFVSFSERMAELLADEGVNRSVDASEWRQPMAVLSRAMRRGDLEAGLIGAVQEAGKILARHAPRGEGDVNELSDAVVELPPQR